MKAIDPIFIAYGLITLFLLIATFIILKKSLSMVNYLFSLSPLLLAFVGALNMLNYFINVPDLLSRTLYLLATLGIFFASVYIFEGDQLIHDLNIMGFTTLYIIYALALSFYVQLHYDSLPVSLIHFSIIIPVLISLFYYSKVKSLIPESKMAINTLIIGAFIMCFGSIMRGYYFLTVSPQGDFLPGLGIIIVGIIIVILSFTAFSSKQSTPK